MLFFTIPDTPVPQKQTQWTRSGHVYNPSYKDIKRVQDIARTQYKGDPIDTPITMHLNFFLKKPKSYSFKKAGHSLHVKKPDVDNLAYLITNALKKIVYLDDSQIYRMEIEKQYDENPRTEIKIQQNTVEKQ